jgi:hypothetical protein
MSDEVSVTEELLRAACPSHGGWYSEQLEILGLVPPLKSGWQSRVVGRSLTRAQADRLVALRHGPHPEQGVLFQR